VNVCSDRHGESPILEELEFGGRTVPPPKTIQLLPVRVDDEILDDPFAANSRFVAMLEKNGSGWKDAGFRKVANTPARAGDESPAHSGTFVFWSGLAAEYRQRRQLPLRFR
jgi:hypothetical protein